MTDQLDAIYKLAGDIGVAGGVPILVGGSVRDFVMAGKTAPDFDNNVTQTDYDIEVFQLEWDQLKRMLARENYRYDEVGESFRALKVHVPGCILPVDVSLPRREKAVGDGHRDFEVIGDPFMTFEEASSRRDFTINSMGFSFLTGEILDPHGGATDIGVRQLDYVSDSFAEDPLRPLRAARFAARFGFGFSWRLMKVISEIRSLADSLPSERIWMEIEKAVHESKYLGDFFGYIDWMGWGDLFPEIHALREVAQDKEWHPEGDVFQHTMHALTYWSQNLRTGNKEDDLITATSILCHDFGKVTTTEWNEEKQHVTAYGHEEAGAEPTRTFLHRLRQYELAKEVVPLVENHLAPVYSSPTPKSIRRLSVKVKRLDLLATVSRADQAGRPPKEYGVGFDAIEKFEMVWKSMSIPVGGPKPLVGGDYLIAMGFKPGPVFKTILDDVYEKQIEGEVTTEWEAHERVHFFIREWALN